MRLFFRILFNKYLLATAAFIAWVGFFDTYDYGSQKAQQMELDQINADIQALTDSSVAMEGRARRLNSDPAELERYAREHFHMKRDTEDVYVITQ